MTTEEFRRDQDEKEMKYEREVTWFVGICCLVTTVAWVRFLVGVLF